MGSLLAKLRRILKEQYPPPDKIQLKDEDGVMGVVVSSRFDGMPSLERVNRIWDFLENKLTPEEASKVVLLLAVTPEEELLHSA